MLTILEKVNLLQKVPLFHGVRTESLARVASAAPLSVALPKTWMVPLPATSNVVFARVAVDWLALSQAVGVARKVWLSTVPLES